MPDRFGRIKGILVPAVPWKKDEDPTPAPITRKEKVLSDGRKVETDGAPETEKR